MTPDEMALDALMDEFAAGNVEADAVIARLQSEANLLEVVAASQRNAAKIFAILDDEGRQSFARIVAGV